MSKQLKNNKILIRGNSVQKLIKGDLEAKQRSV